MDVLQSWIVVGVPVLIAAAGLFVGRSQLRAWLGYALLFALVVFFLAVPGDGVSAALAGLAAFAFVATGRGTAADARYREHHQDRRRFTTAADRVEG